MKRLGLGLLLLALATIASPARAQEASCVVSRTMAKEVPATFYPVPLTDQCHLLVMTSDAAVTVALPQKTGSMPDGWRVTIRAKGAGGVSIISTGSTIDGSTTPIMLAQGQSIDIWTDKTNYFTAAGTGLPAGLYQTAPIVYQNQRNPPNGANYMALTGQHNQFYGSHTVFVSTDQSLLVNDLISSPQAGDVITMSGNVAGAVGGPFSNSVTVGAGEGYMSVTNRLCQAWLNNTAWMTAIRNFKPTNPYAQKPPGYFPVQAAEEGDIVGGCAAQIFDVNGPTVPIPYAQFAYDYPWDEDGLNTLSVSKTAGSGTTVVNHQVYGLDGGYQIEMGKFIRNRNNAAKDLTAWLGIVGQAGASSGGLDRQLVGVYGKFSDPNSVQWRTTTYQNGSTNDRMLTGLGTAFTTIAQPADACLDPGDGKVRICSTGATGHVDQAMQPGITANVGVQWSGAGGIVLTSGLAAHFNQGLSNPPGTTSPTGVHMGLGTTCTITPTATGRVVFELQGTMTNNTNNDGVAVQVQAGTGSAPINGAAAAGLIGSRAVYVTIEPAGTSLFPFRVAVQSTVLAVGTPYWYDAVVAAFTGGTASVSNLQCNAREF